jgi:hypothetical protein
MQSKRQSIIETAAQVGCGFVVSVFAGQMIIYPLFNIHPGWFGNMAITGAFTVTSIIKQYVVRRLCNRLER